MRELPTGEVTFVFTDIEGSTSMLQRLGRDRFLTVLEEHNTLMRTAFSTGVEIRTEGDSFFYVFSSATAAVDAALDAQGALATHRWPDGGIVAVRIGMHTGEGALGGDDYVGLDVHRAARIGAAGHGGQVLMSASTRAAAPESGARDLGEHRFKDIDASERIFQAVGSGFGADFPPIRSMDTRPNNLPAQPSEMVGRSKEIEEISALLESARLATVTGAGGTGKTRLAIHIASQLLGRFSDGVVYVPLESVRDEALVIPAIVSALNLDGSETLDPLDAVANALGAKDVLLVLDNFEHVIDAAPGISDLLARSPNIRILVTSQALLRIRGEHAYPVPPLPIQEGVDFFTTRVAAVDPSFTPNSSDHDLISALVAMLEGMPLAIELAAARIRLFGLQGLVNRVADHFEFADASTDRPERHRTTTLAIEWSYDLLDDLEKGVLKRLGIFDGGFTLEAAEAVAGDSAMDAVASLLDKSLLQSRLGGGEARFSMLDSIRRFSLKKLDEEGGHSDTAARHASYFADLAESTRPLLEGNRQQAWLDRIGVEHHNIRAVYHHSVRIDRPEEGLRAVGALWRFFHRRGHMRESRTWLTNLLDMPGASTAARAEGLNGLAAMLYWKGDMGAAIEMYDQVLGLFRSLSQTERVADTLFALSSAWNFNGDPDQGAGYGTEAKTAYVQAEVPEGIPRVIAADAFRVWQSGLLDESYVQWSEARELFSSLGDTAEVLQAELVMAAITHQRGHVVEAIELARGLLVRMHETDDIPGTIMVLGFVGSILAADDPDRALRIGTAATALRSQFGGALRPTDYGFQLAEEIAGDSMANDLYEVASDEGRSMGLIEAVEYGLDTIDSRRATHSE